MNAIGWLLDSCARHATRAIAAALGILAILASIGSPALAQQQALAAPDASIYTRAQVRSLPSPKTGEESMLRLKILPRAQVPLSTMAFQVRDIALLKGLSVGDEVAFKALRIGGENVVVAIRRVEPCLRFQPCPPITD